MRNISWCPCLNTRLPTAPGINTDRINAVYCNLINFYFRVFFAVLVKSMEAKYYKIDMSVFTKMLVNV